MYRRWQLWLGIPALALAALLLTTNSAAAQRGGRRGGNAYYGNGYHNGYYGNGYHNGYYGNGYYGNGFYGIGVLGNGYGRGYGNGYYGNGYGYTYPNDYADYDPNYQGQPPQYQQPGYSALYPPEDMPQNAAMVQVRVPSNAELWFAGDKTTQTGPAREFVTPELKQDKSYFYTLKARWTDGDGKAVERTRRVQVRPGAHVMVDFNRNTAADTPARTEKRADTPDRGENREEGRELVPATDRVKPTPDRTPARPIPNTPRNNEVVP
jgi:uncharacterized protein (TIGR03000 family)